MDIEMPAPEEVVVKATPSKYISEDIMLSIRCQVFHIDFEGRSDFESMKNIIQQLAPRKVVCNFLEEWRSSTCSFLSMALINLSKTFPTFALNLIKSLMKYSLLL